MIPSPTHLRPLFVRRIAEPAHGEVNTLDEIPVTINNHGTAFLQSQAPAEPTPRLLGSTRCMRPTTFLLVYKRRTAYRLYRDVPVAPEGFIFGHFTDGRNACAAEPRICSAITIPISMFPWALCGSTGERIRSVCTTCAVSLHQCIHAQSTLSA